MTENKVVGDWTKYVTINPPMAVIFKDNQEDGKSASNIDIINKSTTEYILFKVKTTDPGNYIVRPNQGIINPESNINVKILCQLNLQQVSNLRNETLFLEWAEHNERQIPCATRQVFSSGY